jgi:amino acid adenylation domain-containing protein
MRNLIRRIAGFPLKKHDHLSAKSVDDKKEEEIAQSQGSLQRRASNSFPLTFAQQRLWYLNQLVPNRFVYNMPVALRLTGKLDVDALEQSLNEFIRRHSALRTSFRVEGAEPVQTVTPVLRLILSRMDMRALPETEQEERVEHLAIQELHRAFDLSQSPLLRVNLFQLGEEKHVLLLIMHHIISDSWSLKVFLHELVILYQFFSNQRASLLPDLPMQYTDFAVQQRQWLQTEEAEKQLAYWKEQLVGAPPMLQLPTDRPRPAIQSFQGAYHSFQLSGVLTEALKALSQRQGVTLFITLLAAVNTLLFRYIRQDDIIVGTTVANRRPAELEGLIGFFANTLVLRTDLSGNPRFVEVLERVREVALAAYAHQDLPFERLVEEVQPKGDLSYHPLFQVMVAMHDTSMDVWELPDLTLIPLQVESKMTPFDIAFEFSQTPQGLRVHILYSSDLFDAITIARLTGHLETLVEGIAAHREERIGELPILTESERERLLVQWNDTTVAYPSDQCVHHLFEAQVRRTPQAVALVYGEQVLTYRELNQCANQLAHYLRQLGVGPEVLVGLCMERSVEMVVGLLGILKAGGAYVPLDPSFPAERIAFMLEDAQAPVLLTQQRLVERLPQHDLQLICLDTQWEVIAQQAPENLLNNEVTTENVAYVIYTSGSTGQPKGVLITHGAIVDHCYTIKKYYELDSSDRVLQFSTITFDASLEQILPTLITGASLILRGTEVWTPTELHKKMRDFGLTVVNLPTAYWHQLTQEWAHTSELTSDLQLRLMIVGGERMLPEYLAFWQQLSLQSVRLLNAYGPTETTITATIFEIPRRSYKDVPSKNIPIGRPLSNRTTYILDDYGNPVPIGVAGDLYIGGGLLARGYLNRPELTTEKFISNPFSKEPNARLYKTGDLARYLPDGNIEFLGRIDSQVKIRGFRIELGEIEAVLRHHPDIREAVVIAREDVPGDKRLVAYVVARKESTPPIRDLYHFLKEQLPDYMLPSAFVLLKVFPMTPNGKIDRRALPSPDVTDVRDGAIAAPNTPTEKRLVAIVAPLLRLQRVGIDDNFFLIGGNSLMGMQLVAQVAEVFGIDFPLRTLFNAPTVRQLAAEIERLILVRLQTMDEDEARYLLKEVSGAS